MKKSLMILAAIIVSLSAALFVSCRNSNLNSSINQDKFDDNVDATGSVSQTIAQDNTVVEPSDTEIPDETNLPAAETPTSDDCLDKQNKTAESMLTLDCDNRKICPFVVLYSGERYMEDLNALMHFTEVPVDLVSILPSLPELNIGEEYQVSTDDNVSVISLCIYSVDKQNPANVNVIAEKYDNMESLILEDYIDTLSIDNDYVIQIKIGATGKYISEVNHSEYFIYSCWFKLSA